MAKNAYGKPMISTSPCFDTSALACGKTLDPPPGSMHFSSAYISFTGHLGGGFGGDESYSGSAVAGGHGASSQSYSYTGLCGNWVTYTS